MSVIHNRFRVFAWDSDGTATRKARFSSREYAMRYAGDMWQIPFIRAVEVVDNETGAAILKLEEAGL